VQEFRAYHSGFFEDKKEEFIEMNYPEYLTKTFPEKFYNPIYGEESIAAQVERVKRGLLAVYSYEISGPIIICTHFSVINVIANLAVNNLDISTYGNGIFNIEIGELLRLNVERDTLLSSL
jgi:broad specificity phosphatase PhoE